VSSIRSMMAICCIGQRRSVTMRLRRQGSRLLFECRVDPRWRRVMLSHVPLRLFADPLVLEVVHQKLHCLRMISIEELLC